MSEEERQPRRGATAVLAAVVALAGVLAWLVTPWFWVAVPFAVVGAYAMWLGLTATQALDALDPSSDPGGGPAGMHP